MSNIVGTVLYGQLIFAIPVALLAGFISFASPCVLPLVPGYFAYLGGSLDQGTRKARQRLVLGTVLFVLGFAVIFIAYGALFGTFGGWLIRWQDLIVRILGVVVIITGASFLGYIPVLQRTLKLNLKNTGSIAGAPLLGVVFGLGWTPCLGPTLTAISALSLNTGSAWRGALLGLIYCIGLGLPFLLLALGIGWASNALKLLRKHSRLINRIGGLGLITIGVLMLTGVWSAWLYQLQALMGSVILPL
ncbi:cytochrome C biogenesis protein [Subtercola boreus]|uniref:Cytochrome C biogenesis protein n=1 Tax=Subtercola boreus TaxID=120213 RepID=A0A3E0V9T6_9MICO|nr:cytochrome c biogenesis protein CcdA [Subtercola boreus]RFA06474.1 cytochrome C biogenesis protein [Subtercola boreus]TQL46922.1 cytochrome c-type biogenesis protein [Subtercola boreus]